MFETMPIGRQPPNSIARANRFLFAYRLCFAKYVYDSN